MGFPSGYWKFRSDNMQASTLTVKGTTCFGVQKKTVVPGFSRFRSRSAPRHRSIFMTNRTSCFGLRLGSVTMETELTNTRIAISSIFGSSAKPRSVTAQASGLPSAAAVAFTVFTVLFIIWQFPVQKFLNFNYQSCN